MKLDWEEYCREQMDNYQWWRDRYREIENHGYRLDDPDDPDPEVRPFMLMFPPLPRKCRLLDISYSYVDPAARHSVCNALVG